MARLGRADDERASGGDQDTVRRIDRRYDAGALGSHACGGSRLGDQYAGVSDGAGFGGDRSSATGAFGRGAAIAVLQRGAVRRPVLSALERSPRGRSGSLLAMGRSRWNAVG